MLDDYYDPGRRITCPHVGCSAWFGTEAGLNSHLDRIHGSKTPYKEPTGSVVCPACEETYICPSPAALWEHLENAHWPKTVGLVSPWTVERILVSFESYIAFAVWCRENGRA